ncbi:hypothetical protein [Clostridium sp. DMHC 10]|uniref:hypothetical protein n=1 Tax=Clostridium sp. DMHC 10 TaxID=747377 RepID=UPI000A6FCD98
MKPIIPIVMLLLCLICGGLTLLFLKKNSKRTKVTENKEQKTANEFVNVKDVKERYLYTRDGYIIMYIKINPISIDLLSEREKKLYVRLSQQNFQVSKSLISF